ncbi:MAG: hypothetical protein OD811_06325 [Alphaproteobacteria bacterium]
MIAILRKWLAAGLVAESGQVQLANEEAGKRRAAAGLRVPPSLGRHWNERSRAQPA